MTTATTPEARPNDIALARAAAAGTLLPAGRVERLLPSARGDRVLIERAFGRGTYLVAPAAVVHDADLDNETGVRWLRLSISLEALYAQGVYTRSSGFLTRLPAPPLPSAAMDDARARAALESAVRAEPMAAGGQVSLRVHCGVAVLSGWIGTVGGKVQVERLARTTPGVWEAFNRIVSDEEIRAEVRRALLAEPALAPLVAEARTDLGAVEVTLRPAAPSSAAERARALLLALPGVRSVRLTPGTEEDAGTGVRGAAPSTSASR